MVAVELCLKVYFDATLLCGIYAGVASGLLWMSLICQRIILSEMSLH